MRARQAIAMLVDDDFCDLVRKEAQAKTALVSMIGAIWNECCPGLPMADFGDLNQYENLARYVLSALGRYLPAQTPGVERVNAYLEFAYPRL